MVSTTPLQGVNISSILIRINKKNKEKIFYIYKDCWKKKNNRDKYLMEEYFSV